MTSPGPSHRQVWEVLPWVLNGSASEADRRSVEEHLRECADCREAMVFERQVRDALARGEGRLGESEAGWQQLAARLDHSATPARRWRDHGRAVGARLAPATLSGWLAAAVIVEALALGALVGSSWVNRVERVPAGVYRTLSQPQTAARLPTIRVVLAPDMTLEQFRSLLSSAHLQVVAGPGEAGVWSLAPTQDIDTVATEAALLELRGNAQVRFAEPVNGSTHANAP